MGPLYHVVDPGNRQRALEELRRVLRPGAPAIVAFPLNPWGILRAGLAEFPEEYAQLSVSVGCSETGLRRAAGKRSPRPCFSRHPG